MAQLHIDRLFHTGPANVWQILSDFEARNLQGLKVEILDPGNKENNHVGLIREIRTNGTRVREKILTVTPQESIEYQLLSGAPVHDYFGTIFLYPEREGTTVRWVITFKTSFPWPEWIVKKQIIKTINNILDQIGKAIK
jgi:hypothetical protein